MPTFETRPPGVAHGTVTNRFEELADRLNRYLQQFREFGIRSNRAVAEHLCVDSAELSRLKNARVGDINLQRGYEILRKCDELSRRLLQFGGPLKCKDVYSVGYNVSQLDCGRPTEQLHAISLQQQSDRVLLTVDDAIQCRELDALIAEVNRSVVHPRRNPYGPMCLMYVLKSVYAAPSATASQMKHALAIVQLGRKSCGPESFNPVFGDEYRRRTLAVILNNGGGIALRLSKECPSLKSRMLKLSKFLHMESLATCYFAGTINGALTCANDLQDDGWAASLLTLFVEKDGLDRTRWPKGVVADLSDAEEWGWLKQNRFWHLLDGECGEA